MQIEIRNLRENRKQLDGPRDPKGKDQSKAPAPVLRLGSIDDEELQTLAKSHPDKITKESADRVALWPRRVFVEMDVWREMIKLAGPTLRKWVEDKEIEVLGIPGADPFAVAA